jgi:hypothetical protein
MRDKRPLGLRNFAIIKRTVNELSASHPSAKYTEKYSAEHNGTLLVYMREAADAAVFLMPVPANKMVSVWPRLERREQREKKKNR